MKELFNPENRKKFDIKKLNEVINLSSKILKIIYILLIVSVLYSATLIFKEWGITSFILTLLKVMTPFFIGLVIAWLFEPVVRYLEKHKINRILGTVIVYLILIFFAYLVFNTMIPILFSQVNDLIKALPSILEDIIKWFDNLFSGLSSNQYIDFDLIKENATTTINDMVNNISSTLPKTLIDIVSNIFSGLGVLILGLMVGFYLLFDFDDAGKLFYKLSPKKYRNDLRQLSMEVNNSLLGYVKGTVITSGLVFVSSSIGFYIVGLQAPLLFGLICGITNIIPYIGPYIGAFFAVVVGFSQSATVGVFVVVALVIIQGIEGNFINPLIMSKAMKLHPVTIMIGLLIFQHFFGIIGMILATPIIAAFKLLFIFLKKKYDLYKENKESESKYEPEE